MERMYIALAEARYHIAGTEVIERAVFSMNATPMAGSNGDTVYRKPTINECEAHMVKEGANKKWSVIRVFNADGGMYHVP